VITASAGDSGYGSQVPAAFNTVTAVGGTTLKRASNTRGWSETVWSATGSGCSGFIAKPGWQTDTGCKKRTISDVSADANPSTGVAVYDTFNERGWLVFGGTSVSSPIIASVYALAGNAASVTYGSYAYSHRTGLYDVTSGSNGSCGGSYLCTAKVGYDGPTGLGTPKGTSAFWGLRVAFENYQEGLWVYRSPFKDMGGIGKIGRYGWGITSKFGYPSILNLEVSSKNIYLRFGARLGGWKAKIMTSMNQVNSMRNVPAPGMPGASTGSTTSLGFMNRQGNIGNTTVGVAPKFAPTLTEDDAVGQARLLKALADPTRLRILSLLSRHEGEVCVFEIVESFTLEQPTISHHLRILRDAGLVDCRKKGLWAYYYVRREALARAGEVINGLAWYFAQVQASCS
jgi:DNA-binding transcriptional ArsR family regulator